MTRPINKCDWCLVRNSTVVRMYFEDELVYWLCERCRDDLKRLRKLKGNENVLDISSE